MFLISQITALHVSPSERKFELLPDFLVDSTSFVLGFFF